MPRFTLSDHQRRELELAIQAVREVRLYRRLTAVELAGREYTVREIADIFRLSQDTVRSYLGVYQSGGLEALRETPRGGRPRKLPPEYDGSPGSVSTWQVLLARNPASIAELRTTSQAWTLRLLADYMRVLHGVQVSEVTIHNALRRAKVSRGPPRAARRDRATPPPGRLTALI